MSTTDNERPKKQMKTMNKPVANVEDTGKQIPPMEEEFAEFIEKALENGVGLGNNSGKQENVVQYYSRTRDPTAKYLSNFRILTGGLVVNGKVYPSVESAFQCTKLDYVETKMEEGKKKELKTNFQKGGKFDKENPKSPGYADAFVKRMGGRSFYTKNGLELDMVKWEHDRLDIMKKLLHLRFDQDPKFKAIIKACKKGSIELKHFERPPRKPKEHFWGTSFDKTPPGKWRDNEKGNWHGRLLMELYKEVD